MKLYELPRGSLFTVDDGKLLNYEAQPVYYFSHIDGMYSYCKDPFGNVIHFSASTPVTPYDPDNSKI